MGKKVVLTESQLCDIIKECVNEACDEAWNQEQFANFAGQADGALNTFGGKLRGFFDRDWKLRKERQKNNFANIAANGSEMYKNSVINAKDDSANVTGKNRLNTYYTYDGENVGYDKDYKDEAPFKIRRSQFNVYEPKDGGAPIISKGPKNGEMTEPYEYSRKAREEYKDDDKRMFREYVGSEREKMGKDARMLNRSYANGKESAMGKNKGINGKDGKPIGGTGMKNGYIRKSSRKNR